MWHTASCQARIWTKNDTCAWNKLNSWFPFQICPLSFSKILPVPVWSFTTEEAAKIFWSDQRQSNGQPTECILILVSHAMKCVIVPGNWYSRLESKHSFLFLMQKNDLFPLYRGIRLNVSNIIFSDLTPVSKCRLSYFVLARWVAFDHTLCLSALSTRLKVEDF